MKTTLTAVIAVSALLAGAGVAQADITSNLVAHWTCDETSGTMIADTSGSATVHNAPENNLGRAFPTDDSEWVTGIVGGALQFNGSSNGANLLVGAPGTGHADYNLHSGAFTVSTWVKPLADNQLIFLHAMCCVADPGWALTVGNDSFFGGGVPDVGQANTLIFQIGARGNATYVQSGTITYGQWYHVAVTHDGLDGTGTMTMYVNNVAVDTITNAMLASVAADNCQLQIGGDYTYAGGGGRNMYDGLLDDGRIYGRELTVDDVGELYALGIPEPASMSLLALGALGVLARKRRK